MKNIPLPSHRVLETHALADWLELVALVAADSQSSIADLESALRQATLAELSSFEKIESKLLEAFSEVKNRSDIASESYPFQLSGSGSIKLKNEGIDYYMPYIFCLCISFFSHDQSNEGPILFEQLSCSAAEEYLAGKSVRFGFPRQSMPPSFPEAVKALTLQLEEGEGFLGVSYDSEKDDGLDIVAWKIIDSQRPNKIILFGQCSTGQDWESSKQGLRPGYFVNQWMQDSLVSPEPLRCLFVPHTVENHRWDKACRRSGILFDRCRISLWASLRASTLQDAREWINKTLNRQCNIVLP